LISSLRRKEKAYLESLLLDISPHSIKPWLWELFKLKESILLEKRSKIKIRALELRLLGVWVSLEDIHQIMQKL
jgi:hypothetical protein